MVSADCCLKMSSLRMSVNILLPDVKSRVPKRMELHRRKQIWIFTSDLFESLQPSKVNLVGGESTGISPST